MTGSDKLKRLAVLVSVGRHPVSGVARHSRNDAIALEIARTLASTHHAALDVLHAGDPENPALIDYLALGAERVDVLACCDGADVVPSLAQRLRGCDLVLTGTRAEGAYDSGMLPYRLAEALGYPLIDAALDVALEDGRVAVRQFLPKGRRRRIDAALPAVVAVHPLANARPRYAYARARAGSIETHAAAMQPDDEAAQWRLTRAEHKPVRLAAAEKRSGHARMLAATTTESRGGRVVIDGSSVEKAQAILAYLREHQLIDY
jgi:electron transfer flavoprotein beta subunit